MILKKKKKKKKIIIIIINFEEYNKIEDDFESIFLFSKVEYFLTFLLLILDILI